MPRDPLCHRCGHAIAAAMPRHAIGSEGTALVKATRLQHRNARPAAGRSQPMLIKDATPTRR